MQSIRVPGDKSLTHRSLLLAALADGTSVIRGALDGGDTRSTADVLRVLGCSIPPLTGDVVVHGTGLRGFTPPAIQLDCGNSGTTARLLMGVLAAQAFDAVLTGDASLRSRPMRRVTVPLAAMGARFDELGAPDRLPIRVRGGALDAIDYVSPHASAQVKSAVLLAGLCAGVGVSVTEPRPSRDHTERMLTHLGVPLRQTATAAGVVTTLDPVARLDPFTFDVPGDFSSAAFLIAFALLSDGPPLRIEGVGINPTRTGFLEVIRRMGADVSVEGERESCGEPVGDIVARRSSLRGTRVGAAEIPALIDEVPILAALAARADGETTIDGAAELRVKESDRIRAMADNLRGLGVEVEELPDGLTVQGSAAPPARRRPDAGRPPHRHDVRRARRPARQRHPTR